MLTAQRQQQWIEESPIPVSQPPRVIKVKAKQKKYEYGIHKLCALMIATAFILGILLLVEHAAVISQGYKIIALNKEINALNASNDRLEFKIGQLKSLRRVEYLAKAQLGMVKADENSTEFLDIGAKAVPDKLAVQNTLQPVSAKTVNPLVDAINNVVKDWFSKAPTTEINFKG